ncbi:DVU_1551 family NTP transferase [Desulfovibrio intestinalis]|uniref:CTP:molybdopterin cytidylyltransferase MocA n=1 Tax=Desulfovibrio intestinalis TaxID=58621 RepID=A0A7W8FDT8_9BACT|nr:CTP:molybdopterin cytidylyltransferase MocA [Desulfovibrio intestinalis]
MNARVLILAAGQASRMGKVKGLLPLPLGEAGHECSALEGLACLFRSVGIEHISVVTGWHADSVELAAQDIGLAVVRNPRPEDGMFSSVCAGLRALADANSALPQAPVLVLPVDVPLVRPMTVQALLEAHEADSEHVFVPVFAGAEGHPPLLPACHMEHILRHAQSNGENGLRGALEGLPVRRIPVADKLMLLDMDRPEDYENIRLLAQYRDVLLPDEAVELLHLHDVPEKGLRHGRAVGTVAAALARALQRARSARNTHAAKAAGLAPGLTPELVPDFALAGGLLHDICKGEKRHEAAAGRLLRSLHLPVMAHLVEDHRDLTLPAEQPITERELIFLADKYCYGSSYVPVRQRFEQKLEIFGSDAAEAIKGRMARALTLEARLARELGCIADGPLHTQAADCGREAASAESLHSLYPAYPVHPADIARSALAEMAAQSS